MQAAMSPRCAAALACCSRQPAQRLQPSSSRSMLRLGGRGSTSLLGGKHLAGGCSNGVRTCAIFGFGNSSTEAGVYGSQGRDDYSADDVSDYFNYMGMLASEGTYDRLDQMLATGMHPCDILLLMAASEDDAPKVEELLRVGADVGVQDDKGRTPLQLASKDEVLDLLKAKAGASA